MRNRSVFQAFLLAALSMVSAACVQREVVVRQAPPPAKHPAYLRALSDLREARWLIQHRNGEGVANGDEEVAIEEINQSISEIRRAAFDDGKDANYLPPPDVHADRPGRLHDALKVLKRVHSDLAREEDNGYAEGLRDRALQHVDAARHATENAIHALAGVE